jgi:membrane protein
MSKPGKIKSTFNFIKSLFSGFSEDKGMKFSASLSYYTVFSIAPVLILIISIFGLVLGREAVNKQIFGQINGLVGNEAAKQIEQMIGATYKTGGSFTASIVSIVVLVLGATGIFAEIQDSINSIWGLKSKQKSGIVKILLTRLISFSLIISLGFVAMVSLVLNAIVDFISTQLANIVPGAGMYFLMILNNALTLVLTTFMFAVIFKVLPDAKIKWRDVIKGALFTAVLFMIGRLLIGLYVSKSDLTSVYGAAGSIVIILVWVYYSAVILYLGAEFTKVYAIKYGSNIRPNDYAVWVKNKPDEESKESLNQVKEEVHPQVASNR